MAYTKKDWLLPDPITDVALDNMENGIADAHAVLDATGTPSSLSATTTNAIGVATAKAKSDHTHAISASAPPSTQAFGDAAVVGTSAHLARADHKHAMPTMAAVSAKGTLTAQVDPAEEQAPYGIVEVSFGKTFAAAPFVFWTPNVGHPDVKVYLDSVSTTGFTLEVWESPAYELAVDINWAALAI